MDTTEFLPCDEFYSEALSFFNCARIVQESPDRISDSQMLSSPIIYLFRHSAELLLKALIIRELFEQCINRLESTNSSTSQSNSFFYALS